jgi:hypothetical protein
VRLQYEIATTGQDQLRSVLRGVEREAMASDKRLANQRRASAREVTVGPRGVAQAQVRQMREQAAAERQRHRQAIAHTKTEERAKIQAERNLARARESLDRQRSRALVQQHNEAERSARRAAIHQRRTAERIGTGAARSVGGATGNVVRIGAGAMGLAGGFAAAEALREQSAIQREASMLANQAGNPGLKGALAREATSVRGLSGTETLKGMGEFVTKTGDLDTARQIKGSMGDLSLATGAEFGDLMATAGQAFNVLKDQISDPVERLSELNTLMGVLAQQGAMGAVEIKDLAQDFGKLGAATRGFQGSAPDLLRTMGAFAQVAVARGGAESSADASTAASRLVGDIVTHKKKFAALGVGIQSKTDPTKLADPMQIIADTLEKTKGDVMKTSGLFGLESGKIFKGFAATFSEAEKKKKGSGREAVMGEFNKFAGAKLSQSDVTARAASRMDDPDLQFKEAAKVFNTAVGRELAPVAVQLAHQFAELVPLAATMARVVAKFIGFLVENPMAGVGLLVGAALVKDITSAGVGEMVKKALGALSGAGGDGKGGAPVGTSVAGAASATFMGATVGFAAAVAIFAAGVANFEDGETKAKMGGADVVRMRELAAKSKTETLTDEEQKEVRDIQMRRGKAATDAGVVGSGEAAIATGLKIAKLAGPVGWAAAGVSSLMGSDSDSQAQKLARPDAQNQINTQGAFSKETDALRTTIEANTAALKAAADKIAASGGGKSPEASRVAPMISPSRG